MEKMRKKKEERMHVQSNKRKRKVMCVQYVSWKVYMHLTIRKIKLLV